VSTATSAQPAGHGQAPGYAQPGTWAHAAQPGAAREPSTFVSASVQPAYTVENWDIASLSNARAHAKARPHVPTKDLTGWWGCSGCCGPTYLYSCCEGCLCGVHMLFYLLPCPCFCAHRIGKENAFIHGKHNTEELVIADRDKLVDYNLCCGDTPQFICDRQEGCCG